MILVVQTIQIITGRRNRQSYECQMSIRPTIAVYYMHVPIFQHTYYLLVIVSWKMFSFSQNVDDFFFPFALLCRVGSIMYLVFIQWYYRQSFSEHPTSGTGTDQSFLTLIGPYKFGKADLRNEYLTFAGNGLRSRATYHTTSVSWLSHYMRRGSFNSKLLQKQFRGRLKKFWHQQYSNMNS